MAYVKTAAEIRPADVSVVSVPHTGTHWIERTLQGMGLSVRKAHLGAPEVPFWLDEGGPIVVPLRDPVMAAISFLNRDHASLVSRLEGFKTLSEWVGRRNVLFFKVDCPEDERAARICALKKFVGASGKVEVDWSPARSEPDPDGLKGQYAKGRIDPRLDRALEILADDVIVDFFRKFGYSYPVGATR